MTSERIYLDHNATTPVDPRVLDAMLPYFTRVYGNAASVDHEFGYEAKQAVDQARERIAALLRAHPDEIVFTSGATESDNLALLGVCERYAQKGDHLITCVTEHKAVLDCCKRLEHLGRQVTYLPVDHYGCVDPEAVRRAIRPSTVLISVMAANNEIGTLAPLEEIGAVAAEYGVLFHTDAAQAAGHISLDVRRMNIHLLSLSAHKMYGPKGVGALYVRSSNPRARVAPILYGGGHERGMRSGTLNVPGIVGFGEAAKVAQEEMEEDTGRFRRWTRQMLDDFRRELEGVTLNGHPVERLPNNLNISFAGIESKALIVGLKNVAVATGSACTSLSVEPSHVIRALDPEDRRAHSAIRLSVGRGNTDAQIATAIRTIVSGVEQLRRLSGWRSER